MEKLGVVIISDARKVVFSRAKYKGKERLDIREKINTNYSSEEPNWVWTRRGVSIPIQEWDQFFRVVKKVKNKMEEI